MHSVPAHLEPDSPPDKLKNILQESGALITSN